MGKLAWKVIGLGGGALAAIAARKAISLAWEKSLGRPAPNDPNDTDTDMAEVIAWTIVSGVGVAIAQIVVQRYAAQAIRSQFGNEAVAESN